jgi:SprT-like family
MRTLWSNERLRLLFERYNRIYWRGKLCGYRVVLADLSEKRAIGYCYRREKRIEIDPNQHTSDRELRATLLHEMAHAAAREPGHGVRFFAQMERLIRLGAPVTVRSPEAGLAQILANIVPKRFPLVREKMEHAENLRARRIIAWQKAHPNVHTENITSEMIVRDFGDAEACTLTWKWALVAIGLQYGLTDDSGRPVNAWARNVIRRARKAHRTARREHLQYERRRALLSPAENCSENCSEKRSNFRRYTPLSVIVQPD